MSITFYKASFCKVAESVRRIRSNTVAKVHNSGHANARLPHRCAVPIGHRNNDSRLGRVAVLQRCLARIATKGGGGGIGAWSPTRALRLDQATGSPT